MALSDLILLAFHWGPKGQTDKKDVAVYVKLPRSHSRNSPVACLCSGPFSDSRPGSVSFQISHLSGLRY